MRPLKFMTFSWSVSLLVVLAASLAATAQTPSTAWVFDRTALVDSARQLFAPLEPLLRPGDKFDYERVAFFSGLPNGDNEHILYVPLTQDSPSFVAARSIGISETWESIKYFDLAALYIFPPKNFAPFLQAGVPYLIRVSGWDKAAMIDPAGVEHPGPRVTAIRGGFPSSGTPLSPYSQREWFQFAGNNFGTHAGSCWVVFTDNTGN